MFFLRHGTLFNILFSLHSHPDTLSITLSHNTFTLRIWNISIFFSSLHHLFLPFFGVVFNFFSVHDAYYIMSNFNKPIKLMIFFPFLEKSKTKKAYIELIGSRNFWKEQEKVIHTVLRSTHKMVLRFINQCCCYLLILLVSLNGKASRATHPIFHNEISFYHTRHQGKKKKKKKKQKRDCQECFRLKQFCRPESSQIHQDFIHHQRKIIQNYNWWTVWRNDGQFCEELFRNLVKILNRDSLFVV